MTPTQTPPLTAAAVPAPANAAPGKPFYLNLLSMALPPALNYAQKWLNQEHLQSLLETLPSQLEKTGSQTMARFRKMSTVEKVASGLLLVIVVRHFLRSDQE